MLESNRYKVVTIDSADEVTDRLEAQVFHTVLVRDSLAGSRADLVARARRVSPTTAVRFYKNGASLLLDDAPPVESDLFVKNLDLLVSLLACKAGMPSCRGVRVAQYAEGLCRRLELPEKDRLIITNAAYLHNLAAAYYGPDRIKDDLQSVQPTVNLLESLDFPPVVLDVLRSMHTDIETPTVLELADRGPRRQHPHRGRRAVPDAFPRATTCRSTGSTPCGPSCSGSPARPCCTEVADGLIEMLQERILDTALPRRSAQVMIYCQDPDNRRRIETRIKPEGFRTVTADSLEALADSTAGAGRTCCCWRRPAASPECCRSSTR